MTTTYGDIVTTISDAGLSTEDVATVVLSEVSMESFLSDDNMMTTDEVETADRLGEFSMDIEEGEEDKLVLTDGREITL